MSFRYENYGTADLLTVSGTTVTLDSAKYGTAFYQTTQSKCFDIPACQEIWIKCDIYTTASYNRDSNQHRMRVYNLGSSGACGFATAVSGSHTYGMLQTFYNGTSQSTGTNRNSSFVKNKAYSLLLHMKAGTSDGIVEWQLSDGRADSYIGNINDGADFEDIFIQCASDTILISNAIVSDEEIGLNENARMPFEIINDTERTLTNYSLFSLTADTRREVKANFALNNDTIRKIIGNFRYENYGTADLLSVSGTTVTTDNSKYGTAFYQTVMTKCFDIPATEEIWIKFDVYFDDTNRWRAYNTSSNGSCGICSYVNAAGGNFGMWQNSNRVKDFQNVCKPHVLQTFLLHMVSSSTDGIIEAWVDGEKIYTYVGDVNHGDLFEDIYLQSNGEGTYFSNVIISNSEIGLDENARMPFEIINDTERNLLSYTVFSLNADTERELQIHFNLSCDTIKKVPHMILLDALI